MNTKYINNQSYNKTLFYDFFSNPNNPEELFSPLYLLSKSDKNEIYKAIYNETREIFCIKKICLDNIFIDKKTSKKFYNQMKEETSLMKSLTNNENILQYFGSFFSFETKNIYLIYEYLKGGSVLDLGKILDRNLTEEEIAIIINDILHGLIYLHQLNIVNRNIKINNILLTQDGKAKIGNFEKAIQKLNFNRNKNANEESDSFDNDKNNNNNDEKTDDPKYDIFLLGLICIDMFIGIKNKFDKDLFIEQINLNKLFTFNISIILETEIGKNSSNKISNEFKDFIIKCLDPYSYKRPTAFELTNHPFIKINVNEINANNFSNLVKNNLEKIENYKNNRINKINLTKNSINLSNINNTNNSFDNKSNTDKLAEFRIEQMKKNEIIEDDKFTSKDLYSDLDNNSFLLNNKEKKEKKKENSNILESEKENDLDNIIIKESDDLNIGIDFKSKWEHIKNFQNKLTTPKFSNHNLNYNYNSNMLKFPSLEEEKNPNFSLKNSLSINTFSLKNGLTASEVKCDVIKLEPNISQKPLKRTLNDSSIFSSKMSTSPKNKENKRLKNSLTLKNTINLNNDIDNKISTRDGSLKSKNIIREIILEKRNSCTPFKIKRNKLEENNDFLNEFYNDCYTEKYDGECFYKYLDDSSDNNNEIKRQKTSVIKVDKLYKSRSQKYIRRIKFE